MSNQKKLTPAEWEIMDAIWQIGDAPSIRDVVETAFPNGEKAYTTVQTIMNILVKKGLLTTQKIGLVNFYSPVLKRDRFVKSETNLLVDRVFQGSIPAFANYLIQSNDLNQDDIQQLKELLDQKERELRETNHD